MPLAFEAAILSRMNAAPRSFSPQSGNLRQYQHLGFHSGEHSEREKTERNAKRRANDAKKRAKSVHSVRDAFARSTDPPDKRKAAPSLGTGRGKPLGEGFKSSKATDSHSGVALQARQARLRYLASWLQSPSIISSTNSSAARAGLPTELVKSYGGSLPAVFAIDGGRGQ
jgi:hypothetical protein